MRLWSIDPKALDVKGLVSCWREGLGAQKVLDGQTVGYKNHPQLDRFREAGDGAIGYYLETIWEEANSRGYNFDRSKIGKVDPKAKVKVNAGQLEYERGLLYSKISERRPQDLWRVVEYGRLAGKTMIVVDSNKVNDWERT